MDKKNKNGNFRRVASAVVTVGLLSSISGAAQADTKPFAYTYPAKTIPAEELELEHYLDIGLQGWDNPDTAKEESNWSEVEWKHQLELEYGITDAWDFGFYNVFSQKPYSTFQYDGVKLRSRYNFGEGRNWVIDPGLYLEVGFFGDAVKFEEMIILSAGSGPFFTSLNLKGEQEIEYGESETEVEYEAIVGYGLGFYLGSNAGLSLEYYGKAKFAEGEMEYMVNYLGPTFHVASGPFYWNIAVQPQLGTDSEQSAIRIRSLFSVMF